MKTLTIKKFKLMSVAKVSAALHAFLGLVFGAIMTLVSLAASSTAEAGFTGVLFGIGAIVLLPIFYGLMGFVSGLLMGAVFNFVAPKVGGLTFEVEEQSGLGT